MANVFEQLVGKITGSRQSEVAKRAAGIESAAQTAAAETFNPYEQLGLGALGQLKAIYGIGPPPAMTPAAAEAPQQQTVQQPPPTQSRYPNPQDNPFLSEGGKRAAAMGYSTTPGGGVSGPIANAISQATGRAPNNTRSMFSRVANVLDRQPDDQARTAMDVPGGLYNDQVRTATGGGGMGGGAGGFSLSQIPGYKAGLGAGVEAIQRSAAAKGMMGSGNALQDLFGFGQRYAGEAFQQHLGNLLNLTNIGMQATANKSNLTTGAAASTAAGQIMSERAGSVQLGKLMQFGAAAIGGPIGGVIAGGLGGAFGGGGGSPSPEASWWQQGIVPSAGV